MPRGEVRKYGRKVVVPASHETFDALISQTVGAGRLKRASPFCSSDSSHASSPLIPQPATAAAVSGGGGGARKHRAKKQENVLNQESPHNKKKKKMVCKENCPPHAHDSRRKKKMMMMNKDNGHDDSTINLFHEESCYFVMSTPIKGRKIGKVQQERNTSTTTTNKSSKLTLGAAVAVETATTNSFSRHKNLASPDINHHHHVPDFDSIEQDELIIDISMPRVGGSSTPKVEGSHATPGHSFSLFGSPSLISADNSSCSPDHSLANIGSPSLISADSSSCISSPGQSQVSASHSFANITFRQSRKKLPPPLKQQRQKTSKNKYSPDSGNMSSSSCNHLLSPHLPTCQISHKNTNIPRCSTHASHRGTDNVTCPGRDRDLPHRLRANIEASPVTVNTWTDSSSCNVDDVMNSFDSLHLGTSSRLQASSSSAAAAKQAHDDDSLVIPCSPVELEEEEESCYSSYNHQSSPLHQILEENTSCYSEEEDDDESEAANTSEEEEEESEDEIEEDKEDEAQTVEEENNRYNLTLYQLVNSMSFTEMLSDTSLCDGVTVNARSKVLSLCGQLEPVSFSHAIPPRMMSKCIKIGEGVYGEVFRSFSDGETVALKIIPIEGDKQVNDCPQKTFAEILPEVVIAKELSDLCFCQSNQTHNFCQVKRISCVEGEFPSKLLEQWDLYSQRKVSENDRPDMFPKDQLFIVFEFIDGGSPLENFQFSNHIQAFSVLRQVVFALAVAETELEFEHRDLHIGNVLVQPCQEQSLLFKLCGQEYQLPTEGVRATIIDFTISRLKKDGCAVFCDVSSDDGLFEGTGDFQFDVYRDMRTQNGNNWQHFQPHTNIQWINYLCKKLVSTVKYKDTGRTFRDIQRHMKSMVDTLLDYSSCQHLASDSSIMWQQQQS